MEDKQENRGSKFERLGFAYCKIATVSLLLGRFALPAAALLSAIFFITGWFGGKKDTKCIGKYPLAVAGFWLIIFSLWLITEFNPSALPIWVTWIHR